MSDVAPKWFPDTPALAAFSTPNLTLEPFDPSHLDFVQRYAADWNVAQWLARVPHPYPDDGAQTFLNLSQATFEAGEAVRWVVKDRLSGEPLGFVGLDSQRGGWHIGYWFAPHAWGRGVATEAAFHALTFGFWYMELPAIESGVLADNPASKRVLEKCGFEGWAEGMIDTAHGGTKRHLETTMTRADFDEFVFSGGCTMQPQLDRSVPVVWVVAAALFNDQDQVLVAQRPKGKSLEGLWEFPGGKMEPNEGPEAALIRELKEELGIDVGIGCLAPLTFASFPYPKFHLMMPLYAARKWQGEPTGQEGQALKWVSKFELRDLEMPPADVPLVPVIMDWM